MGFKVMTGHRHRPTWDRPQWAREVGRTGIVEFGAGINDTSYSESGIFHKLSKYNGLLARSLNDQENFRAMHPKQNSNFINSPPNPPNYVRT